LAILLRNRADVLSAARRRFGARVDAVEATDASPGGPVAAISTCEARLRDAARGFRSNDGRAVAIEMCAAHVRRVGAIAAADASGDSGAWIARLEDDCALAALHALTATPVLSPGPWSVIVRTLRADEIGRAAALRLAMYGIVGYALPLSIARVGLGDDWLASEGVYDTASVALADVICEMARARRAGAEVLGDWVMTLRRKAWADGGALFDTDEGDDRAPVYARIERDVLRDVARVLRPGQAA
jgi:hypothetical protein